MRFSIERDALTDAVAWVARALPTRPVLPILAGLLLTATDDGGLILSCFDYEVSARIRLDADVEEPGTVLVPGKLLADITRSLPGLPVRVDSSSGDVAMSCGAAAFSLVTMPVEEYPQLPELPVVAGTVDGGILAGAISQVVPAASRDDTLPILTGVNIELASGLMTLVATDRYRLAVRELDWNPSRKDAEASFLTPAKTLSDAARMMAPGTPVQIMLRGDGRTGDGRDGDGRDGDERGWPALTGTSEGLRPAEAMIGFESGGRRLTTRLIAGEFIKYKSRFPAEFGCKGDMPAGVLTEAVKRVALVAERGSPVRLTFGTDQVTIEAGSDGQARAREAVAAEFTGDQDWIAFSPGYLLDGLGAALVAAAGQGEEEARIRIEFSSPTKPAVITAATKGSPDFRYLVVPLRALNGV